MARKEPVPAHTRMFSIQRKEVCFKKLRCDFKMFDHVARSFGSLSVVIRSEVECCDILSQKAI
jgi:hypothetical protein